MGDRLGNQAPAVIRQPIASRAGDLVLALAGYALVAIPLTWPLVRDSRTRVIGEITYDMRHALWVMWHTTQSLAGRAAWPWTDDLYYPYGISVLVDGVGPFNALLGLPFWPLGPEAVYNGAAFTGIVLSGWCMYLLARHVLDDRRAAFVAGLLFMVWPFHLSGIYGHIEKLFVGWLPLSVLAARIAFDPARSRAWLWAPGVTLLGALLQNGNQFMFAMFAVTLIGLRALARANGTGRLVVFRRQAAAAAISVAVCLPILALILRPVRHPWMDVALAAHAWRYSPDLLHLLLPSSHQWIGGWLFPSDVPLGDMVWQTAIPQLQPTEQWYGTGVETAVTIPLVALLLAVAGWRRYPVETRWWLFFAGVFTLLCLGPWLRVAGLGRAELGIPLPAVVLRRIPGLDMMRTPGRFMMMASVGFALAAGFGVRALSERLSRRGAIVVAVIAIAALVECWPRPWQQMVLPRVPAFYRQLASDPERYGVLDLPHGWLGESSRASAYHSYQLVHRKPIAWASLSREYTRYPNDGLDAIWTGDPAGALAARARLRELGYRYVVWHKHAAELFAVGRVSEGAAERPRGPAVPAFSDTFVRTAFHHDRPVVDDDLVTVFRVGP